MTNYYELRAFPGREDHYELFLKNHIIGLGWPLLGDLTNTDLDKLTIMFRNIDGYDAKTPAALGRRCSYFETSINKIKIGDIIIVPDNHGKVAICKVTSDYFFKRYSNQLSHVRKMHLIKEVPVDNLSEKMQSSIATQSTIFSLQKYADEIENLLNDTDSSQKIQESNIRIITGKVNNKDMYLGVPSNTTKDEFMKFVQSIGDYLN